MRFEVAGMPMGSEVRVEGPVSLEAEVVGTNGIQTVRVVKNGTILYALDPRGDAARFEFVDPDGAPDGAYYYLDIVQNDGEKAVSSPVWVN